MHLTTFDVVPDEVYDGARVQHMQFHIQDILTYQPIEVLQRQVAYMYDCLNCQLLHPLLSILTLPAQFLYDRETLLTKLWVISKRAHVLQCSVIVKEYEEQFIEQLGWINKRLKVLQPIYELLKDGGCKLWVYDCCLQIHTLYNPLSRLLVNLPTLTEDIIIGLHDETQHLSQ